jgi:hypothetical protein
VIHTERRALLASVPAVLLQLVLLALALRAQVPSVVGTMVVGKTPQLTVQSSMSKTELFRSRTLE